MKVNFECHIYFSTICAGSKEGNKPKRYTEVKRKRKPKGKSRIFNSLRINKIIFQKESLLLQYASNQRGNSQIVILSKKHLAEKYPSSKLRFKSG